jgi:ubiquinone/menaquinone biosynthesis C-methylase UbiE
MEKTIESVQRYWNARPCNIRHSNKEFGTKEYFDDVEWRKYFVEPHIPVFANFLEWKDKKVLEIGCGIGTDTVNFAKQGAILTSVDLSTESLAVTHERLKVYEIRDKVKLQYANAEKLSQLVTPEPYDLVYSFGVLHHTPNPIAAFEEVKKFMDKDSIFKLMVYNKGAFKVFQILEEYDFNYEMAEDLIAKHSEAQTGCPVTYSYTPKEITNILESLGFEVTDVYIDHIFPYKIEQYKKYEYVKEDIWEAISGDAFSTFESKYGWHLMVTAKLK